MPSLKMPRPEKKISGSFCSFARIPMKRYALHRISCLPNNNNNNSQSGIDAIKSSFCAIHQIIISHREHAIETARPASLYTDTNRKELHPSFRRLVDFDWASNNKKILPDEPRKKEEPLGSYSFLIFLASVCDGPDKRNVVLWLYEFLPYWFPSITSLFLLYFSFFSMIIIIHQTSKMLRNYYGSVIFLEFFFFSFARLWNIRSPGRPKVVHVEREERGGMVERRRR